MPCPFSSALLTTLTIILSVASLARGISLTDPSGVASSLHHRQEACKAFNNCPPPPSQRVLEGIPWKATRKPSKQAYRKKVLH